MDTKFCKCLIIKNLKFNKRFILVKIAGKIKTLK